MLKPVPPAPSDSLLYAPAVFVKSVLPQTQEEISESVHVQLHGELFKVITFKQVVWDRDVCRALSLSLWWQGGEIQQEWEGRTALQVRVPGQGVGGTGGTLRLLGMCIVWAQPVRKMLLAFNQTHSLLFLFSFPHSLPSSTSLPK